jgi:hypothetical protein
LKKTKFFRKTGENQLLMAIRNTVLKVISFKSAKNKGSKGVFCNIFKTISRSHSGNNFTFGGLELNTPLRSPTEVSKQKSFLNKLDHYSQLHGERGLKGITVVN